MKTRSAYAFASILLICLLTLAGCKKDEEKQANGPSGTITIPKPGTYTYLSQTNSGAVATAKEIYSNPRDSAGAKVEDLLMLIGNDQVPSEVVGTSRTITYASNPPASFLTYMQQTAATTGGNVTVSLHGWPKLITLTRVPAVGDSIVFSPLSPGLHMEVKQPNGTMTIDWEMYFQKGHAVAINQSVKTPAGTFTCTEWQYEINSVTTGAVQQTQLTEVTIWYDPEVGVVKSTEADANDTTETILQSIQQ